MLLISSLYYKLSAVDRGEARETRLVADSWEYQWDQVCIYHLLRAAFSQCVAVSKVIDLNVFDEVTVLLIYFVVEGRAFFRGRGRFRCASGCVGSLRVARCVSECFFISLVVSD